MSKLYRLLGVDRKPYVSATKGTLGGNRRLKIYGLLDCPNALRWIAKGHYVANRVFFADEATAIAAGYRPCGICLRADYEGFKQDPTAWRRERLARIAEAAGAGAASGMGPVANCAEIPDLDRGRPG